MTYRVIFKDEGTTNGEPYGPLYVIKGQPKKDGKIGRPFQPKCFCDDQKMGERNEWGFPVCESCDGEIEQWVKRSQAIAVAEEFGVELQES
jgi:hypothetical protein